MAVPATPSTAAAVLAAGFTLASPDLEDGALTPTHEFAGFGCSGGNASPALSWTEPPPGTQSFALLVHDADAPTGGAGWWHWVVVDLPADTRSLPAGAGSGGTLPTGARQMRTDFGATGWGGPCPPPGHGVHHYTFTLVALKVPTLDVSADATASLVGYMALSQSLGTATVVGTYER